MADTLLLDLTTWDLVLDVHGNIAVAEAPYALAQDAASAIRTFLGEVYYDTTIGIPYFDEVLGYAPPLNLLKTLLVNAALTVPGVASAQVFISSVKGRVVTGQVQVTMPTGEISAVNFSGAPNVNPNAGEFKLDFSQLGSSDVLAP